MTTPNDWPALNERRGELMDLEDKGCLTMAQAEELARLQRQADELLESLEPWREDEVDRLVKRAKAAGKWPKEEI